MQNVGLKLYTSGAKVQKSALMIIEFEFAHGHVGPGGNTLLSSQQLQRLLVDAFVLHGSKAPISE